MKKQIKYLCDSGSKLQAAKSNEAREGIYKYAKQSLEEIIVREEGTQDGFKERRGQEKYEKTMTWGHVKKKNCGIHQPWYKRLEQYRD